MSAGDRSKAAEQHALAAEHAVSRYAAEAVFDPVGRALALLDALPVSRAHRELQWRLRMTRVFVLETRGQHARHLADIDVLTALSDELGDDLKRAKVADKRCTYAMLTADRSGAMTAARQTMACAERVGDHRLQLIGLRMMAWAHCGLGDWDAGHRLLRECLARALELQMPGIEAATGVAHQARDQGHVNLVCHLVLARAMDPRADAWLQRAHGQLLATAANISDAALREGFLANTPDHRAILAAWAASGQGEHQARQREVGIR